MQNIAINLASNLDDEQLSVHSLSPHPAPAGAARRAAAARLTAAMDALDAKAAHINPEEFEAAVDDAMNHFRRR